MTDFNQKVIEEFRSNQGKVGGIFANMDLLLLHTTGAKTGQSRLNPTAYIKDRDRLIIAASKGGADTHPDWYFNLVANPDVVVEVGTKKFAARAEPASEPERTELYDKLKSIYPGFAEYEERTSRVIPVVTLVKTTA
jgi:deazaflavin-dependent oxidoreductase (nitroreductase family)